MSIQPDNWIRYMAQTYKMIEPFEDKQVRYINDGKKKVVSYGVSSYGYDLRVSDEYKVFTNVLNSIVDPKNFDDNSSGRDRSSPCARRGFRSG